VVVSPLCFFLRHALLFDAPQARRFSKDALPFFNRETFYKLKMRDSERLLLLGFWGWGWVGGRDASATPARRSLGSAFC
jgi:hypothetical protein